MDKYSQLPPVMIPPDIGVWYRSTMFSPSLLGRLTPKILSQSIYDPQIFAVIKSRPGFQFAAQDAWRRMMWRKGGLSRSSREAVAVAVSISNSCCY